MKNQINENSTKKIGEYLTLKEARKALVEKECDHVCNCNWGYYFSPVPIYKENDGTYSIHTPVSKNAEFVEAVDAQSGRRFYRVNYHGEWKYAPKKKIQFCTGYRGYDIIFPD